MTHKKLPHETVWNFATEPFRMEPRTAFGCLFCGGPMVVSHGQLFDFHLHLHPEAKEQGIRSFAMDTWLFCWDCFWTVVHGVAVPKALHNAFAKMMVRALRIDGKGKPVELSDDKRRDEEARLDIPQKMAYTIFPFDKDAGTRKRSGPRWAETISPQGLKPLFPTTCKMCGYEGDMFLRHSRAHKVQQRQEKKTIKVPFTKGRYELRLSKLLGKEVAVSAFRISYKCPLCDWLATFVPPVRDEYFNRILELREGQPLYYPPREDWASDDKLIQDKLETLGYV